MKAFSAMGIGYEASRMDGSGFPPSCYTLDVKSLLKRILEQWFPPIAKMIRFRAIGQVPLHSLLSRRLFEPELALIKPLLTNTTGLCLDVGAHVGEYCYALERYVASSRIHAFEPNPQTFSTLESFFPKIQVWNMALSDSVGTVELRVPILKSKHYATRGTLENYTEPGASGFDVFSVERTTLDTFRTRLQGPVCFLKIDVEGHERKVLAGGKKTIQADQPMMLIEIEERRHELPIKNIFQEIESLGYRGFFLNLRAWELSPIASFNSKLMQNVEKIKSIDYINNFLFLPLSGVELLLQKLRQSLGAKPSKG